MKHSLSFCPAPAHTAHTEATHDENPFAALLGAPVGMPAYAPAGSFAALLGQPMVAAPKPEPTLLDGLLGKALAAAPREVKTVTPPPQVPRTRRMICRCALGRNCGKPGRDGWGLRPDE